MRRVRMTADHGPPPGPVLRLHAGQLVEVGARDDEWPSWVRCTAADGSAGWVPEHFLAREAPEFEQATVLHDYEATELELPAGETLEVLREEEGWLWCRTEHGDTGWVPERSTEPT